MYIIDGYNLLHALAKHRGMPVASGQLARVRLIELLAHLARRESALVRVFFDGDPGPIRPGELDHSGLQVRFCGEGRESADHAVREHVQNASRAEKLRVVSSDRAVATACRLAGAKIIKAQEMAERLAKLAAEGRAPRDGSVEKPTRGRVGKAEREMLDDIGDEGDFERDVLRKLKGKRSADERG
jgi:predicted RNA-binding protein with PIN domain